MLINQMVVHFKRRYSVHYAPADRDKHPVTIMCRVSVGNRAASPFSTKLKLLPQFWDQANQCARPDCPDAATINTALGRLRTRLSVIHNRYEYDEQAVTAAQIVADLRGRATAPRTGAVRLKRDGITMATLLQKHLAYLRGQVVADSPGRDHGIVLETWKVYNRYTNNILGFARSDQPLLRAIDLDARWMARFLQQMNQAGRDGYYTAKHLYYVKTTLDWGVNEKLITYNPVSTYDIDRNDSDAELVFLYDDEIERFENTDFSVLPAVAEIAPALDRIRDAFLIMMEIGQHYADYKAFVKSPDEHLRMVKGVLFFRKRRQKTRQWALVPVSDRMARVGAKYGGYRGLPTPCNKTFNLYLKVIATVCNIQKNLTTKAARKTFADLAINEEEIDLDTVARMMGLNGTAYIQKYARIDERRILKKKGIRPKE